MPLDGPNAESTALRGADMWAPGKGKKASGCRNTEGNEGGGDGEQP